jgi:hypothetical protein
MSELIKSDMLPEIEGVDQLDKAPEGSKAFTKTYYSDAADELIERVRSLPNRAVHCIVPRIGWPKFIYRRATR